MKKSNRFLRNTNTAKRSRLRQMFFRSLKARKQARQNVFFTQGSSES